MDHSGWRVVAFRCAVVVQCGSALKWVVLWCGVVRRRCQ